MKIRRSPHCPEMEQLLKKLPSWLFWAGIMVAIYLVILLVLEKEYLNLVGW